jgi:DNA invertase Pin-like site-specific DNA recombinase
MIIGYARTSTTDQIAGLEAQLRELQSAGCAKIFKEQASSVDTRVQLESAIEFIREGDVLVVTKLDRLARSVSDLMKIIGELENKKISLRILNLGMDTSTPTGKLMLTVLGGIAQFEREIMLERQREGIAKAKTEGKYKGRKSIQSDIKQQVIQLVASGESKVEVARKLRIGEATVYRILRNLKSSAKNEIQTAFNS